MALPGYAILALLGSIPHSGQVQPAGIDLRVGEVHEIVSGGFLGRVERRIPESKPLETEGGVWRLGPGIYRIVFADIVNVPENAVGLCFPRSSLVRMGATLYCAVWDPGYRGRGQALLHVLNPNGIVLEASARVAQLVLIRVEPPPVKPYEGYFQSEGLRGRS